MKRKTEYLALIVVVAALGLYLAFHDTDRTQYDLPRPAAVDKKEITRIVIEKPDAELELKKAGDSWIIAPKDYPADSNAIQQMLDAVADFNLTALVSQGENDIPYNLDAENRLQVSAWAGDKQVRLFYVGKPASSYRHTFVKLPDDTRIYHAAGNLRTTFEKQPDALRDKTVLAVDKAEIGSMVVAKGDRTRQLTLIQPAAAVNAEEGAAEAPEPPKEPPKAPQWQTAAGETVDRAEVDRLLGAVSDLKCSRFIEGKTKEDLTDPIYTLTLSGGSRTHTLCIYEKPEEDADYPAVASGSDYPFELRSYKAEEIMKHLLPESRSGEDAPKSAK